MNRVSHKVVGRDVATTPEAVAFVWIERKRVLYNPQIVLQQTVW